MWFWRISEYENTNAFGIKEQYRRMATTWHAAMILLMTATIAYAHLWYPRMEKRHDVDIETELNLHWTFLNWQSEQDGKRCESTGVMHVTLYHGHYQPSGGIRPPARRRPFLQHCLIEVLVLSFWSALVVITYIPITALSESTFVHSMDPAIV